MFIVLLSLIPLTAFGGVEYPKNLTYDQKEILKIAFEEGKLIGYPLTMQSIVWQETRGGKGEREKYGIVGDRTTSKGKKRPLGKKSYGVCQVRLSSAKDVLKKFPALGSFRTDEELLVALITDDRFNIRIATYHFKLQLNMFSKEKNAWKKAVLAYNVGCGRVKKDGFEFDPNKYLSSICHYVVFLKNNPVIK